MPTPLCDLFESDEEVQLRDLDKDEVDQVEDPLNFEVCEESDDEEYEVIKHKNVYIQWLTNQFKHILLTLHL